MGVSIFLILVLGLIHYSQCAWDKPTEVYKNDGTISWQISRSDTYNDRTHIIFFSQQTDYFGLMYIRLDASGKILGPIKLSQGLLEGTLYSAGIAVSDDGQDVCVAYLESKGRNNDVKFCESEDAGATWSEPICPRSDNLNDTYDRTKISVVRSNTGDIYLFYKKGEMNLTIASRMEGSKTWEPEQPIHFYDCPNLASSIPYAEITYQTPSQYTLHFAMNCKYNTKSIIFGDSNDKLNSWKWYNQGMYQPHIDLSVLLAAKENRLYGAFRQQTANNSKERNIGTVFEDAGNGHLETIASLLAPRFVFHSLAVCDIKSERKIIYTVSKDSYKSENGGMLLVISESEPWKQSFLPLPILTATTNNLQILCGQNDLVAIGTNENNAIFSAKYSFD